MFLRVRLLSPEEIKEYCGLIRTDDLIGGLWVPGKVPAFRQSLFSHRQELEIIQCGLTLGVVD
jgi:hypothetical protein